MTDETRQALYIAEQLIEFGIPVFAAAPCPAARGGTCTTPGHAEGRTEFHLPPKWQLTVPSKMWLEKWQPGWALAMVGGHRADMLDGDPRHGSDASVRELRAAGDWPRTFGEQATPSGGQHWLISKTGERETNGFMPGLDLQSGAPDGQGRGFAYIAPTVKRSKVTGELAGYRWVDLPDLALLADFEGSDDSITGIRTRVAARGMRRAERANSADGSSEGARSDSANPFVTASEASKIPDNSYSSSREFTPEEARAYVEPALQRLRAARQGEIEEHCNIAAATLSHFVPTFLSAADGMSILREALSHTVYDESHPASQWTVAKFEPVLDGRRPPNDAWKAVQRAVAAPPVLASAAPPEPSSDAVEALLAEMLTLGEVKDRPPPQYLVKGLLNRDSVAWLIGAPGSRKSFVALDMATCVALGRPWQGKKVAQAGVVLIAAEGAGGLGKRVRAWEQLHGPLPTNFRVLPRPVQAADRTAWAVLTEACRRLEPGLVIVDTQARVTVGLNENDATEMGYYVLAADSIRMATQACVLSIHHTGRKGGDARGSSAIDGAQDTELKVEKLDGLNGQLRVEKQKDLEEGDPIPLSFVSLVVGIDEDGDPVTSLALSADPFVSASGALPDAPEEWEVGYGPMQIQIIKVLRDQGRSIGLTKSETFSSLLERFYPTQPRKKKESSFRSAWSRVLELRGQGGDPVAVNVTGEKWIIDEAALASLPAGTWRTDEVAQ